MYMWTKTVRYLTSKKCEKKFDITCNPKTRKFYLMLWNHMYEFTEELWKEFIAEVINAPFLCVLEEEKLCDMCKECTKLIEDYNDDILTGL